jgi:hypothetical protein
VNDDERGLYQDYDDWLEALAPPIYLDTEGTAYIKDLQGSENVSKWKQRIRSFIELALAKLV